MPNGATSFASVRAKPVTAARTLLDRIRLSTGCFTAIDVTLMMRPHRRSFIPGSTARTSSTTLSRFWRTAASQASARAISNGPAGGPPPLVTRMSTRPNAAQCRPPARAATPPGRDVRGDVLHRARRLRADRRRAVSRSASSPRAHSTRSAPSRASSSATRVRVRGSTRRRARPFRAARDPSLLLPVEVAVGVVEPVLAGRAEDVHVERVLERRASCGTFDGMCSTSPARTITSSARSAPIQNLQRALQDVRDLLVVMRVLRDDRIPCSR